MAVYDTPEEEWRAFLSGTHPHVLRGSPFRHIPSSPRCKLCSAPFGAPGALIFRRFGFSPWDKNPNMCGKCFKGLEKHARQCPRGTQDDEVRGAEVEISLLFADIRRSSDLARQMGTMEFTRLMQRFYEASTKVLFGNDAILDKFVGDEAVGFFIPVIAGPQHARRAIKAGEELLRATGHGAEGGPWAPLGAGVHTGIAFVGMVSRGGGSEFTALGDAVNVAAHLAGAAGPGEILVTNGTAAAAGLDTEGLEGRSLSLKGHPVEAVVLTVGDATPAASFREAATEARA